MTALRQETEMPVMRHVQMEYKPWLEETPEGDRDPCASHAYAVAEAAAKAAGTSACAEVCRIAGPKYFPD
jgi:hypothetical protein